MENKDATKYGIVQSCRVCKSEDLEKFFDLGKQPPANSLLPRENSRESFYPLALLFCKNCRLVQLGYTVNPHELFDNYFWVTGTSNVTKRYADKFCEEMLSRVEKPKEGYVLEIASNDGTFLKPFMKRGLSVLGIDPAQNIADSANKDGVPTKVEYWGLDAAQKLLKEKGAAQTVFARNVMFHVAEIEDFTAGLAAILDKNGVLAVEAHYAKIVQEELHYDSIYHEHLFYYSLKSFERLLNIHNLYVFDIMKSPISGGSLVYFIKRGRIKEKPVVATYRAMEEKALTNELAVWKKFARKCKSHQKNFVQLIKSAQKQGLKIAGWGASARSSTMLNFCGINNKLLPVIIDNNPLKQGKFTAGTHIPIKTAKEVMSQKPDCIVILAWNFGDEIVDILRTQYNFKGECIIPLPYKPHILKIK